VSASTSTIVSLRTLLRLGLLAGLIASELELVIRTVRAELRGGMQLTVGIDGWWMGPLAYAVLFCVLTAIVWTATRWLGDALAARAVTLALSAAGLAGLLFLFGQLHPFAVVLLALGGGIQLSGWMMRRASVLDAMTRRALPVATLVVLSAAGVAVGGRAWSERRALAALPAADPGAPNVVLLILDTVRARSLHLYGYQRANTPVLDSLANSGVVFEHAWATAPWTLPSHASIMTGRYPNELSTSLFTPLDGRYRTLAEVLGERGYQTGGFSANVYYASRESGIARGFSYYRDRGVTLGQALLSGSLTSRVSQMTRVRRAIGFHDDLARVRANEINRRFLSWLDGRPDAGRPFFAFLNYMEAHEPYLPEAPYRGRFGPDTARKNWLIGHDGFGPGSRRFRHDMRPHEVAAERAAYDESILAADAEIGRLIAALRARGVLDRTVIVITADHGEQFGGHGKFDHGNSLYRQVLEVPLVVVAPGRAPAGLRIKSSVSLRDLAATILDLSGGARDALPGRSIAALWSGAASPGVVYSELQSRDRRAVREGWSLVMNGLHYVEPASLESQLFDVEADTLEVRDLAADPQMRPVRAALRAMAGRLRQDELEKETRLGGR